MTVCSEIGSRRCKTTESNPWAWVALLQLAPRPKESFSPLSLENRLNALPNVTFVFPLRALEHWPADPV